MRPSSRSRFQRYALPLLGLLLILLGTNRLAHAAARWFGGGPSPEVHVDVEAGEARHRHHAERIELRDVSLRTAASRTATSPRADVLFREEFTVRDGDDLVVDLGAEAVVVETTSSRRASVTVEGEGSDRQREFERRRFSAAYRGGRLVVKTEPERNRLRVNRTNARFTVTIRVPERFNASVDVGSGAVRVGPRLRGDLTVDTGSGSVTVGDVEGGQITLDTGSGSVRAGRLVGDVTVDTGSGSIQIDAVDGPLAADTGSGSVRVGRQRGEATVSTGSGGIRLAMDRVAPLDLDTGSGSVEVRLPRGAHADLALDGGSVRIDDAFDFSGRKERREARGRIGRGGPRIAVETGSGSISILTD